VAVEVDRGGFAVDVTLDVDDGEVVAVVGPNGAGKTTVLRAVAGLEPIARGRVEIGGRVVDEPSTGRWLPPAERGVGYVPQDHVLFPHLSALDNVAFGLRAAGGSRRDAAAAATDWLVRLGLGDRLAARPSSLSGGEAQRVALARALAVGPQVLLLDEPLAALDARTRPQVRAELRRHLADFAGARVLVTHDPVDAAVLADRVVVVEDGRVVQAGTLAEVTRRPRSGFVADLVGVNLLRGRAVDAHTVGLPSGATLTVGGPVAGTDVAVAIRPRSVSLHRAPPHGSPRNAWSATVIAIDPGPDGDRARVTLGGPLDLVAEVTSDALAELDVRPGDGVWAAVKAVEIECYEA
jgi:molybdate transport system ATP-binding protein